MKIDRVHQGNLDFSARGHLYATHPVHAFAARCPPPLAAWAIERYTHPEELVVDPMTGSGTTLVESCLRGRRAWGADIDPLARLITKVKCTPIDDEQLEAAGKDIAKLARSGRLGDKWRPKIDNLDKWFRADVASDLARLRRAIIRNQRGRDVQDFLWVAFSSLIVAKTSVANVRDVVHSRHHYRLWDHDPDVFRRFEQRLGRMRRMMIDYRARLHVLGIDCPQVEMSAVDARALPIRGRQASLVFTSPPYCSALDYTRAHALAVAWMPGALGVSSEEYRLLGRQYIGSTRAPLVEATSRHPLPPESGQREVDVITHALRGSPKDAWVVHRYFRDMTRILNECGRVVQDDGHIILVVCPSNIRRISISTHRIFAKIAESLVFPSSSLHVEHLYERTIHDRRRLMPYLESSFGPRMRTEYVLVLRRIRRISRFPK